VPDPPSPEERWSRGVAAYASQFGIPEAEVPERFSEMVGERMAGEAINAAGGGAWIADSLSLRDRSLIVVAALATQGGVEARLRGHLRWALENGATREELEAMLALLAIYVGYPRASTAMEVLRDELGD
jgi:4-carboxymuconolactone decarboxylase